MDGRGTGAIGSVGGVRAAAPGRRSVYRGVLLLYVLALPATDAFAVNPWLPLPLIVMLLFGYLFAADACFRGRLPGHFLHPSDALLVLLLGTVALSTAVHLGSLTQQEVNHALSYFVVLGVYYWGVRALLHVSRIELDRLLDYLGWSVLIAAAVGVAEVGLRNGLGIDINTLVFRPHGGTFQSNYLGVFRARSLASEPATFALFLETFGPIAVYHGLRRHGRLRASLQAALIATALALTFSAAAIAALAAGCAAAMLAYIGSLLVARRFRAGVIGVVGLTGAIATLAFTFRNHAFVAPLIKKLTFAGGASVMDRLERWRGSWELFEQSPLLGVGAGGFLDPAHTGVGVVSWWLQILVEFGLVGFVLFATAYLVMVALSLRCAGGLRYPMLISVVAVGVHYLVISDYWLPWIWLLFNLVLMVRAAPRGPAVRAP